MKKNLMVLLSLSLMSLSGCKVVRPSVITSIKDMYAIVKLLDYSELKSTKVDTKIYTADDLLVRQETVSKSYDLDNNIWDGVRKLKVLSDFSTESQYYESTEALDFSGEKIEEWINLDLNRFLFKTSFYENDYLALNGVFTLKPKSNTHISIDGKKVVLDSTSFTFTGTLKFKSLKLTYHDENYKVDYLVEVSY